MNSKNVKISIIVPMYNVEKYLEICIHSLVNRNYDNLEIILVDNNSTDGTYKLAEKIQKEDSRIKLYQCVTQGPSAARNLGLQYATGEYVSFVDADDCLSVEAYEYVSKDISKNNPDIILYGYYTIDCNGNKIDESYNYISDGVYKKEKNREFLLHMAFSAKGMNVPSYVYLRVIRKALITNNHIKFDENILRSEDFQFLIKIHALSVVTSCIYSKKFYQYRQNDLSITHNFTPNYWEMIQKIFKDLWEFAQMEKDTELKKRLDLRFLIYTINAINNELRDKKEKIYVKKRINKILYNNCVDRIVGEIGIINGIKYLGYSFLLLKIKSVFLIKMINFIKGVKNG